MLRDAYVFLNLEGVDVPAGRIQHFRESHGDRYYFRYGKSFLNRSGAFSIDPRQLPLSDGVSVHESVPLALQDSGPDDFGRYLYERLHGAPPESPLDYLIDNGSAGIGALSLSTSLDGPQHSKLVTMTDLEELAEAFRALSTRKPLSPNMRTLLQPGTSLPGARPKALLRDENGDEWIVKFTRDNDIFNIPIAEYAAMTAASDHLNVAETRLETIGEHNLFLVKRFDREGEHRRHFLSAYTLMGANRFNPTRFFTDFGYPSIAQLLKQVSSEPHDDRRELFRRMVANVMLGNRDDHLKNHGFLKDGHGPRYRLSPAYDVVPAASGDMHAIGIGGGSPQASLNNIMADHQAFGIERQEALDTVQEMSDLNSKILHLAADSGMPRAELKSMELGMMRLNERGIEKRLGEEADSMSLSELDLSELDFSDFPDQSQSFPPSWDHGR